MKRQLATSSFEDLRSQLATEVKEARLRALGEEARRLETEISAYERLKAQSHFGDDDSEIVPLGLLPIWARIAKGLSQKQLAELLEVKEQQIQRYESDKYAGISLARYEKVLAALEVQLFPEPVSPSTSNSNSEQLELLRSVPANVLREIRDRKWFESAEEVDGLNSPEILAQYIDDGDKLTANRAFHRKTQSAKRPTNDTTLSIWRARALQLAQTKRSAVRGNFNVADISWISELVSLSVHEDGPKRAVSFLNEKGIVVVFESQLPGTSLDGAAILLADRTPLIALTLRYDRLDYFWFTLLHEVGHIVLHFNSGLEEGFFDNFDEVTEEKIEAEADSFARSALISDEAWSASPARFSKTVEPIKMFAATHKIGISIAVGRIRRERKNYALFSEYVGQGKVKRQLMQ